VQVRIRQGTILADHRLPHLLKNFKSEQGN